MKLSSVCLVFLLVAGLAVAAVILCPRCGHELDPGMVTCPHCQRALPSSEPAPEPAPVAQPAPSALNRAALEAEAARARAALDDDRPALAWLYARNLAALMALVPGAADFRDTERALERAALSALRSGTSECPACEGSGRATILSVGINGQVNRQQTVSAKCPACSGRGTWTAFPSDDQLEGAFVPARRTFQDGKRDARWIPEGGAWLPPGTPPLDLRQQVAVRKAISAPCDTCRGSGATGCSSCDGAGRTACTESGCVSGRILCPECGGTRRQSASEDGRTLTRRCPECRQVGVVECPTCKGQACVECDDCSGRGEQACTTCKGSGEKSVCSKCSGEGLRSCSRCKGTGQHRQATCAECGGDGQVICGACQGNGRGKR